MRNKLSIEWLLAADIEKVWKSWVVPDIIKQWYGADPKGTVEYAYIDLREGGSYEIHFSDFDTSSFVVKGTFITIKAPVKLVMTFGWEVEPDFMSTIDLTFIKTRNGTSMMFDFKDYNPDSPHVYEYGWNSAFDKLEKYLTIK